MGSHLIRRAAILEERFYRLRKNPFGGFSFSSPGEVLSLACCGMQLVSWMESVSRRLDWWVLLIRQELFIIEAPKRREEFDSLEDSRCEEKNGAFDQALLGIDAD